MISLSLSPTVLFFFSVFPCDNYAYAPELWFTYTTFFYGIFIAHFVEEKINTSAQREKGEKKRNEKKEKSILFYGGRRRMGWWLVLKQEGMVGVEVHMIK